MILTISIDDDVERRFRETVYQRKGLKKGNLSEAATEAILDWIGKE